MLYLWYAPTFDSDHPLLKTLLASTSTERDPLLFLEEGVYALQCQKSRTFIDSLKGISLHVLKPDLDARGLKLKGWEQIQMINYSEFVELSLRHPQWIHCRP